MSKLPDGGRREVGLLRWKYYLRPETHQITMFQGQTQRCSIYQSNKECAGERGTSNTENPGGSSPLKTKADRRRYHYRTWPSDSNGGF